MSANKIKGLTISINGETTGLDKALSGVNKKSKDLQSELREIEKLLKLDPKNTELLAQKQKLLAESIANTRGKLDTLKASAKQAQEQLERGEISEEQFRALQREVIKTEEVLKKLENQSKDFGDSFTRTLENAGKSLQDVGGKIEGVGKKLMPLSAAAAGVGTGLIGMAVKAGAAADDINTLAKQTGLNTEEIQKYMYAADLIDVPLETITGSLAKLTRNMRTSQEQMSRSPGTLSGAALAFSDLGVEILDSEGKLRSNQDVFEDAIKALGNMEDETQRDAYAMQIFGKSAQDLNPLILGGAEALKELGDEAEAAGLILSQEALDSANEFNDSIDKLKATAAGSFAAIGNELATELIPMMENLSTKVKAFLKWLSSLDGQTLKTILTIAGVVAAVAPMLIIIGKVITAIGIILPLFAKLKVFLMGTSTAVGFLGKAMAFLAANPVVLIVAAVVALIAILVHLWKTNEDFRNFVIKTWESIKTGVGNAIAAVAKFFTETIPEAINTMVTFFEELPDKLLEIGENMIKGLWEGIKSASKWVKEKVTGFVDTIKGWFTGKDGFDTHSPSKWGETVGGNLTAGIAGGLLGGMSRISAAAKKVIGSTQTALNGANFGNALSSKLSAASAAPARNNNGVIRHSGTIRVEGVNSRGEAQAAYDLIIEDLLQGARL